MSEVELAGVPVCILANKQDIETALSFNEIQQELGLDNITKIGME